MADKSGNVFKDEEAGVGAAAAGENAAAPAAAGAKQKKTVRTWTTKKMLYTLRVVNMLNGLLLILTGILVFLTGMVNISFTTVSVQKVDNAPCVSAAGQFGVEGGRVHLPPVTTSNCSNNSSVFPCRLRLPPTWSSSAW